MFMQKKRELILYKILKNEIPSWFFNDSRVVFFLK